MVLGRGGAGTFEALQQQVRASFACQGTQYAQLLRPANGPQEAEVMFIGEAPGRLILTL